MKLFLYNTLGKRTQKFTAINDNNIGLYTCGPTVYNFAHIGNLRTYIFEDILRRTLEFNGYKVKQVMNITDVGHLTSDADTGEDKIEIGTKREGKSAWEIAKKYTDAFLCDLESLNIKKPHTLCKATDHISEMIELIKKIEQKGLVYQIGDGIYFDTSKLDDYGKLANLSVNGLKAGARVDIVEGKRNKTDFALWKFSPKNAKRQMEWDSPWGRGFPGWHIECSAMSIKYLGEHFDIHCGGVDHIPIHHTNEIAQSEAATGKKPWVNYWLHGEFLILENSRMGKSAGNFITLATLKEKGYDPIVYRYLCLGAHYRKPLTFSFDSLEHAKNSYERLKEIVIKIKEESTKNKSHPNQQIQEKYIKLFTDSINNDLNIPEALATFWIMVRDKDITPAQKYSLSIEFDKIFGLGIDHFSKEQNEEITPEIIKLLNKRENFRKNKEWEKADELRKYLNDKGIEIRDTAEGPKIETKKT